MWLLYAVFVNYVISIDDIVRGQEEFIYLALSIFALPSTNQSQMYVQDSAGGSITQILSATLRLNVENNVSTH